MQAPRCRDGAQQAQVLYELLGPGAAQDFLGGLFLRLEERGDRFGAKACLLSPSVSGQRVRLRFAEGGLRGHRPAEGFAAEQRREGRAATVVMDLESEVFLVVVEQWGE